MVACRCVPFPVSLPFFPLYFYRSLLFSQLGFEARGHGRAGMRARPQGMACARCLRAGARDVCADTSACGASFLCRVVWVLLLGVCVVHRSLSHSAAYCVRGVFDGRTGLMLLSCSSSGAGVGTVRQGVRGVCGQNVLWEGYCARRGIRVRVLEEEC
jgi:hypothetical protein